MGTIEFLRQLRLGQYAIFDFVASFALIYLLSPLLSKLFKKVAIDIPKISWFYFILPIGILVHIIFGTYTPMTVDLLDLNGHYILKIVMIGLVVLGTRKIKLIKKKPHKKSP